MNLVLRSDFKKFENLRRDQTRLRELTKSSEQESELKLPAAIQIQKQVTVRFKEKFNKLLFRSLTKKGEINSLFKSNIFQITQLKQNIFQ